MEYIGWVPTITGRLSFSTIGLGSYPSACSRSGEGSEFVLMQRRDLLDVIVPFGNSTDVGKFFRELIANKIFGVSGRFLFVMSAKVEASGEACEGQIHVFPEVKARQAKRELNFHFKSGNPPSEVNQCIDKNLSAACYRCNFRLERQGKLKLFYACGFPGSPDGELPMLLANQAFYFVKDVAHVHQHHDPTHDAITEVTATSNDNPDRTWVSETMFSLYRAIIRYKRFRSEKALFRAAGIIAYARSFEKSYGANPSKEGFYAEELERSLAVAREEIKHFDQKRISQIETFRNVFFAVFGLVVSVVVIAQIDGVLGDADVHSSIVTAAKFIAEKPFVVAIFAILASIFWAVFSHKIEPSENSVVRWLTRSLQGFRLRWFVIFNIIAAALLAAAAWWVLPK